MGFYIVTSQNAFLYYVSNGNLLVADELFSGWLVRAEDSSENALMEVETHYGYRGLAKRSDFRAVSETETRCRMKQSPLFTVKTVVADVLSSPDIRSRCLNILLKSSIVQVLSNVRNGWSFVKTADGTLGYMRTACLEQRADCDTYFLNPSYLKEQSVDKRNEAAFRTGLVACARRWMGTPYRWGGKSSMGVDCSGFVFQCYRQMGILIYRDTRICPGFPIHEIEREQSAPGDLIYFPGHVAMYIGDDSYLHATANEKTPYVTCNSLDPSKPDYREDLAESIVAWGSLKSC